MEQQLWWVLPVEGGIVIQQLLSEKKLTDSVLLLASIRFLSTLEIPNEPLEGSLACVGIARSHPLIVFKALGGDEEYDYYSCPVCEVSFRKECPHAN